MTREEVLAWLEARVEMEGGCMRWRLSVNGAGHPIASVDGKRSRAVKPWLFRQLKGETQPNRKLMPRCNDQRCVNVDHMLQLLPRQVNLRLVKQGRFMTPARLAANRRNGLKCRKYSDDQIVEARRLRATGLTYAEISDKTGIARRTVSRICRGECRTEGLASTSAFLFRGSISITQGRP
jgi:hypothetical protein